MRQSKTIQTDNPDEDEVKAIRNFESNKNKIIFVPQSYQTKKDWKLLVSVSFDKESGAMYVKLSKGKIVKTIPLGKDRFIDVNKSGKMIGIEVLLESMPKEVGKIISRSRDVIELLQ